MYLKDRLNSTNAAQPLQALQVTANRGRIDVDNGGCLPRHTLALELPPIWSLPSSSKFW